MHMDEPALNGSDPETPIAVPEQSIRIEISGVEPHFGIRCASNRIRFELVPAKLQESCAVHSNQQTSVGSFV
jgi:hypothetical protein